MAFLIRNNIKASIEYGSEDSHGMCEDSYGKKIIESIDKEKKKNVIYIIPLF